MFGLAKKLLAPKANPIGVDFGSDSLRLAQVRFDQGEYRLVAAASADVPSHVRHDAASRIAFFIDTTRDLLAQGRFIGRQTVLGLPAALMHIQHLRVPKMDAEATRRALPWEARGKLPIDPNAALLRHVVAGEIFHEQDPKNEIILMAASREFVNAFLSAAAKAHLDVAGMNVEPKAVLDCFAHVYHRKGDSELTNCFVDIGCVGSRAFITRGQDLLFARNIAIGGDQFTQAVSAALGIGFEDAKMLRIRLAAGPAGALGPVQEDAQESRQVAVAGPAETAPAAAAAESEENSFALLGAGLAAGQKQQVGGGSQGQSPAGVAIAATGQPAFTAPSSAPSVGAHPLPADPHAQAALVEQACHEPLAKLVDELELCRRYYESTFPSKPVDRLIFVGGEARQRALCQQIAKAMGLAAQVGDPLVRMGRISEVGIESGIDRRQPQPSWGVAIGLSLGPLTQSHEG